MEPYRRDVEPQPPERADAHCKSSPSSSSIKLSFSNQTNQLMTNRLHHYQVIARVRAVCREPGLHSHNITLIKNGEQYQRSITIGGTNQVILLPEMLTNSNGF